MALQTQSKLGPEQAKLASKLANGNYAKALQLVSGDLEERRNAMLDFLIAAVSSPASGIVTAADRLLQDFDRDKSAIGDILLIMLSWFEDVFYVQQLQEYPDLLKTQLSSQNMTDRVQKFAKNFPQTDVDRAAREIEKAVDLISRNVYLNLVLVNLGLHLRALAIKT